MRNRIRGFTLLELMAVVVIVAVLSVVAVVSYKRYQAKARLMEGYGYVNSLREKEEAYYATYSQYVSTTTDLSSFYPITVGQTVQFTDPPASWGIDCSSASGYGRGILRLGVQSWRLHAMDVCGDGLETGNNRYGAGPWLVYIL